MVQQATFRRGMDGAYRDHSWVKAFVPALRDLVNADLTQSEWRVLICLFTRIHTVGSEIPAFSNTQIAKELGMHPSTSSTAMGKLQARGLVRKHHVSGLVTVTVDPRLVFFGAGDDRRECREHWAARHRDDPQRERPYGMPVSMPGEG